MPDKNPEEHYHEQYDTFMAIPDKDLAGINMPGEEAMQEGKRVSALVTKYKDDLKNSDIDPLFLRTIDPRAEAYAYSVAQCDISLKVEGENKALLKAKTAEGYALRRKIIKSMEYVFRNDKSLLESVAGISKGLGILDMNRDLLSSYKLCNDQKEKMEKSNFNMELAARAIKLHEELAGLTAQVDIDPKKINEAKAICAKAWTYLHEALVEIYAAGRYVFMDDPEIEELFYIDYRQKVARKAGKDNNEEQEQESTTETL